MKDNFSSKADAYARYRPGYPDGVFDYLKGLCEVRLNAWDCGTGNGQIAGKLADFYDHVYATDLSASQLKNAMQRKNIHYSKGSAEKCNFDNDFFNLIAVGQAIHWFEFNQFYDEVYRTSCDGAYLVVMGYSRCKVDSRIDEVVDYLYKDLLGKYWDAERKYIDENYTTIPFPFEEIEVPQFVNSYEWTLDHFMGYLSTWSAVGHYQAAVGENALDLIQQELLSSWGNEEQKSVSFPLLLRIGKVNKSQN